MKRSFPRARVAILVALLAVAAAVAAGAPAAQARTAKVAVESRNLFLGVDIRRVCSICPGGPQTRSDF
jgi:hypothetical protein